MVELRLDRLEKRYGDVHAVKPAQLTVREGEFLVLLGPSGCGKTTLLRMIAGLESISGGDLWMGEQRVNDWTPRQRNVAMVFQNYALYPHLSVYGNLAFPLEAAGLSRERVRERVTEVAGVVGLQDMLARKPRELSGGQRQRVAVGRAMVREPTIFLFDEPLSNLDAKLRENMRGELIRLHARLGKTTIYVTHDQVEAMTMADRVVVMDHGVIQQIGTPREIYEEPANRFVAEFIGSPAMNFIPAALVPDAAGMSLEVAGARTPLPGHERVADGAVTVGFRATDAVLGSTEEGLVRVEIEVRSVQPLGHDVLIDVRAADAEWNAVVQRPWRGTQVEPGERIRLGLHPDRVHLFDPTTGTRLPARQPGTDARASAAMTTAGV